MLLVLLTMAHINESSSNDNADQQIHYLAFSIVKDGKRDFTHVSVNLPRKYGYLKRNFIKIALSFTQDCHA